MNEQNTNMSISQENVGDTNPATAVSSRKKPLSELTDNQLIIAYYQEKKQTEHTSDEMNDEMFKRFPEKYDLKTRSMPPRGGKPLSQYTNKSLLLRYHREKRKYKTLRNDTHNEMIKRFPNDYDQETQTYNENKTPVSEMNADQAFHRFTYMKNTGQQITDALNDVMAKFYPERYYPEFRDFGTKKFEYCSVFTRVAKYNKLKRRKTAGAKLTDDELLFLKQYTEQMDLEQFQDSIIKPVKQNQQTKKIYKFRDMQPARNNTKQVSLIDADIDEMLTQFKQQQNICGGRRCKKQEKFITTATKELTVSVEASLPVDNTEYKTVSINGVPVIRSAKNVTVKTFMDNLILGVHYTDKKDITQWRLWNAEAKPIVASDSSDTIIEKVNFVDNVLYLATDDHSLISMSRKNILRNITRQVPFNINNVKTR